MSRPAVNVALNKPARQSSDLADRSSLPPGAQVAGAATNGVRTGLCGFHTMHEARPWWVVDLRAQYRLYQIRVYNRADSIEAAAQASDLDVSVSSDGVFWVKAYSFTGPAPFGLDGMPLVVPVGQALSLRFVKLQRRGTGPLHLDEVEVYAVPVGDPTGGMSWAEPPMLPPLPEPVVPPRTQPPPPRRPVIHVLPRAGLGNRMLMFMAATALQDRVPDAVISNAGVPEWHLPADALPVPDDDTVFTVSRPGDFNLSDLAERMRTGALTTVVIEDFLQDVNFYPDPERFRGAFRPRPEEIENLPTFAPDEIVLNIRAGEILDGAFHYPLVPPAFYRAIVDATGLKPVMMGQLEPSLYLQALQDVLPEAREIPSQGAIRDFQMLRAAHHIVPSVSTFSWLGAWLSHAETVHLPVIGFYHPTFVPEINLLPLTDPRYRFYLLPHICGVPEHIALDWYRRLDRRWPLIPASQLEFIAQHAPFMKRHADPDLAVDSVWYARTYPDAAWEVAQGWYADPWHHYQAIGKARGYQNQPPDGYDAGTDPIWPAPPRNLAVGCPATQSSVCAASSGHTPEEDAARAVSGTMPHPYAFHTDLEDQPWWQVDLRTQCRIGHVRIFNRCDSEGAMAQATPLVILLSEDGEHWRIVFRSKATALVGGTDGSPLEWHADRGAIARFVRIQLAHRRHLHLRQVEVYGLPAEQSVPDDQ